MILTEEQIAEFKEAAKPLIKYLAENHHPHVTVIVLSNGAEILEGSGTVATDEYIKD